MTVSVLICLRRHLLYVPLLWDDRLTIEFNGSHPCFSTIEIVKDDKVPTIFVAGDSTVGDPRHGPAGNWPTQICQYFKPQVAVCNSAEGMALGKPVGLEN